DRLALRLLLIEEPQTALPLPQPVDRQPPGQHADPGAHAGLGRIVVAGVAPDLPEDLLNHVRGIVRISQDAIGLGTQEGRVDAAQLLQSRGAALGALRADLSLVLVSHTLLLCRRASAGYRRLQERSRRAWRTRRLRAQRDPASRPASATGMIGPMWEARWERRLNGQYRDQTPADATPADNPPSTPATAGRRGKPRTASQKPNATTGNPRAISTLKQ